MKADPSEYALVQVLSSGGESPGPGCSKAG